MRAFSVGDVPPRGSLVGGSAAPRNLSFQSRALRSEKEVQQAIHRFKDFGAHMMASASNALGFDMMTLGLTAIGTYTTSRVDIPLLRAVTCRLLNGDALHVVMREVGSQCMLDLYMICPFHSHF